MSDFTPLYTTPQSESVARWLEALYPLAAPLRCKMLNRGFNDVFEVTAATGERYVFRLSQRRARGEADVGTETEFLLHLDRLGVPVAAPIASRTGGSFVVADAAEGRREGVLFRALDGRTPEAASAADARANGVTLARIHDAAATFRPRAPLYRLDLDHLLRRPLARVLDSGLVTDAATRDEFTALAARTADGVEALQPLTWTHCHGDTHGFNARIDAAGQAAFFDFDDGGPGYLAYDLSVFLWAKVSFGRKLHAIWHAFIAGYRSVRPLPAADYEAAQRFVIARHLWLMGEYASRASEWGSQNVDWIAKQADFLSAWETERLDGRLF